MVAGKQVLFAVGLAFAALAGGCGRSGGLPSSYELRASIGPLQKTRVSEATLTSRLGAPSLVVPTGNRTAWYYAVAEGGAVRLSLVKTVDGAWRVDSMDTLSAPDYEQAKPRK